MILGHIPCAVRREPFCYLYAAVTRDEGNAANGRFPTASGKSEKISGQSIEKLEVEEAWSKTLGKR